MGSLSDPGLVHTSACPITLPQESLLFTADPEQTSIRFSCSDSAVKNWFFHRKWKANRKLLGPMPSTHGTSGKPLGPKLSRHGTNELWMSLVIALNSTKLPEKQVGVAAQSTSSYSLLSRRLFNLLGLMQTCPFSCRFSPGKTNLFC